MAEADADPDPPPDARDAPDARSLVPPQFLPPPPASRPPSVLEVIDPTGKLRTVLAVGARVAVGLAATAWVLSWLPGVPTARFWGVIVLPAAVLAGVAFIPVVFEAGSDVATGQQGRPAGRSRPQLLHGWRASLVTAAVVLVFLGFVPQLFAGPETRVSGTPYEEHGRFFARSVGEVTEITEEAWRAYQASTSRFAAGVVLVIATIAALALTADRQEEARRVDQPAATPARPRPPGAPPPGG